MDTKTPRRRIDIPAELYAELERDAKALHMPVQTMITSMLARQLETNRARAEVPMRDRLSTAKASRKGYAAAHAVGLAVSQDIEAQLAATREDRRVK